MILDAELQFSEAQALTATVASTNTLDLKHKRDIGIGKDLYLVIQSLADPGGTSPSIIIIIETSPNVAFSPFVTIAVSPALTAARFAMGTIYALPWPRQEVDRHNRLKYTLAGTDPTFTVRAFLSSEPPPGWRALPAAKLA